jgi:hypothetical protein
MPLRPVALVRGAEGGPAGDVLGSERLHVVRLEEALRFVERRCAIVVDVDVVVDVRRNRGGVASLLLRFTPDVGESPCEILGVADRRLPTVGAVDDAAVRLFDERAVPGDVARDPNRGARLRDSLGLDCHPGEAIVLAFEADVILRPQALDDLDPFDEARHAIAGRYAIKVPFDAGALLLDYASTHHEDRSATG